MTTAFEIPGQVQTVPHPSGLTMVELSNRHGRARICLQGAHLIDYQPAGQAPVLWLSERSHYAAGKAIRGGIPVCWPWFGDHPTDPTLPAHGFARTADWSVLQSADDGSSTSLTLALDDTPATHRLWPFPFRLTLQVRLGRALTLTLTSHNLDDRPMPLTEALHSYLAVEDITRTRITGLDGERYKDKLKRLESFIQGGPVSVNGETDRVYLDSTGDLTVDDPGNGRRILIHKEGSLSTVIWNPWQEKSAAMADMDDAGYRSMVCVESANALDNGLTIPPGGTHRLVTYIESVRSESSANA